jgi:hypothetical protein
VSIARKLHGKHVSAATVEERLLVEAVFSVWFVLRLYCGNQQEKLVGDLRSVVRTVSCLSIGSLILATRNLFLGASDDRLCVLT